MRIVVLFMKGVPVPTLGGITLVDPATGLPYKAATTEEVVSQLADPNSEIGAVFSSAQSAAQSAASDAAGSAAAAEVARDLAVEAAAHPSDPAVAALIDDPDSQVRASLSATFGTSSGVVELSTDVGNLLTFGTDLKLLLVKSAVLTTLAELGITATAAEINKLAGLLTSATELSYVKGVTSAIQTQLNGKAAIVHTHTKSQITDFPVDEVSDTNYGTLAQTWTVYGGGYEKKANGRLTCWVRCAISPTANAFTGRLWTFPVPFVGSVPSVSVTAESSATTVQNAQADSPTLTSATVGVVRTNTTSTNILCIAEGFWKDI